MKIKCVISRHAPKNLWHLLDDESADQWWADVARATMARLGVKNALECPAEFYVQDADTTKQLQPGVFGVELRLTGVSRGTRELPSFIQAVQELFGHLAVRIQEALAGSTDRVQLFVVEMVDKDVRSQDGSWSQILEVPARWITAQGLEEVQ